MKHMKIALLLYCAITTCLYAIPKEFNLRENDEGMTPNIETGQPHKFDRDRPPPRNEFDKDQSPSPTEYEPSLEPTIVPSRPDSIMLHPTELQITPQRPKIPPRPKRPDTPSPDPLPQFQEDRQSSSPY